MKYIDGIKETDDWSRLRLANRLLMPIKHIPIYEPMTEERILYLTSTNKSVIDIKWVDGQPYELVTLNKGVKSL